MMKMTRRGFFKNCMYSLLTLGLAGKLSAITVSAAESIPVLLYHRIGYTRGPLTVTPEKLSGDLSRLLGNGYMPISLQQFENYMFRQKDDLPENPVLLTFDDGYRDNYEHAFPVLQQYGVAALFFIITGMMKDDNRLSTEQIREMFKHNMSFGSHTVNHQNLAGMTADKIVLELNASKLVLEDILGHEITALAYPGGRYNGTALRIAEECGYLEAFTVQSGLCARGLSNFELPRIPIFNYCSDVLACIEE